MSKHADSLTLRVPPADALALCRQAAGALGWITQAIQAGGFRCTPDSMNAVTLDVSATEAQGGALVLINAEKRRAIGPFNQRYLRNCVEKLKQKVGELAGAEQAPSGTHSAGPPRVLGSTSDRADRAAFKASGSDPEEQESRNLGMRDQRGREGSGGQINWPTKSGTGGEFMVGKAKKAWMEALKQIVREAPVEPISLEGRLRYLKEIEHDVVAGKVTVTPQERRELAEARASAQSDLFHHRSG